MDIFTKSHNCIGYALINQQSIAKSLEVIWWLFTRHVVYNLSVNTLFIDYSYIVCRLSD